MWISTKSVYDCFVLQLIVEKERSSEDLWNIALSLGVADRVRAPQSWWRFPGNQVGFKQGVLQFRRLKSGIPSTHLLRGSELRAHRRFRRDRPEEPPTSSSPSVTARLPIPVGRSLIRTP